MKIFLKCVAGILLVMGAVKAESRVVECTPDTPECYTLTIQNFEFNKAHPLLAELDEPAKNEVERQWRNEFLPGQVNKEFREGRVNASKPRRLIVHVWGVNPEEFLTGSSAFSVDSRGSRKGVGFENVTGKVPIPYSHRGKPTLSIRLRADAMGGLSFPWKATYPGELSSLTCTEDRDTVYPNRISADRGLWVNPETYDDLRKRKPMGTYQVILSKPATSVAGRGVK